MSDCNTEHVEPNATQDVQSVGRVKRVDVPSGYYLQDDDKQGWAFHETQNDRVPLDSSLDYISRQAAIEAIEKIFPVDPMRNDYTQGITCGAALATEYIKQLPSAQPVLTCKGCKYDYYEYAGCRICLREERDLYEPER